MGGSREKRGKDGEHKGALYIHIPHRGEERSWTKDSNPQFNSPPLDQEGPLWDTRARSLFARYFTTDPKSSWECAAYTLESPADA